VTTVLIALLGGVGAAGRYGVDALVTRRWRRDFPLATLVINVGGSLLLGILTGLALYRGASDDLRSVLGTGFCGGYTTFSTASFESVRLLQKRSTRSAAGYVTATVFLTVGAAALGLVAVR
jgi:CrcB protein